MSGSGLLAWTGLRAQTDFLTRSHFRVQALFRSGADFLAQICFRARTGLLARTDFFEGVRNGDRGDDSIVPRFNCRDDSRNHFRRGQATSRIMDEDGSVLTTSNADPLGKSGEGGKPACDGGLTRSGRARDDLDGDTP